MASFLIYPWNAPLPVGAAPARTQGSVLLLVLGLIAVVSVAVVSHSALRQQALLQQQERSALAELHWGLDVLLRQAGHAIDNTEAQAWPPHWQLPADIEQNVSYQVERTLKPCPEGYSGDCYQVTVALQGRANTALSGARNFWAAEGCGAYGYANLPK